MKRQSLYETSINLAEWMREKRKLWGISQEELGKRTGFHANTIRRYEQDETSPTLEDADNIIKTLGGELVIRET